MTPTDLEALRERVRLTAAQRRFLESVGHDGLLTFRRADYRSHGPLLHLGLIAITYSDGTGAGEGGYVLTPAGRAVLSQHQEKAD